MEINNVQCQEVSSCDKKYFLHVVCDKKNFFIWQEIQTFKSNLRQNNVKCWQNFVWVWRFRGSLAPRLPANIPPCCVVKFTFLSTVSYFKDQCYTFSPEWLPRQIDNSVSVSCDVAAVARFFCLGITGRASKVAQNISNKPYLTLPLMGTMRLSSWPQLLTLNLELKLKNG